MPIRALPCSHGPGQFVVVPGARSTAEGTEAYVAGGKAAVSRKLQKKGLARLALAAVQGPPGLEKWPPGPATVQPVLSSPCHQEDLLPGIRTGSTRPGPQTCGP